MKVVVNVEALHVNNNHVKLLSKSIGLGPVDAVIVVDEYTKTVLDGFDKGTRKLCPQMR